MIVRKLVIAVHDAVATIIALFASFFLRWGADAFGARLEPIAIVCGLALPVALVSYRLCRIQQSPWRFVSLTDLNRIVIAVTAPALFLVLVDFLAQGRFAVPRTVPAIYWLVQLFLLAAPRVLYRTYRARRTERRAFKGVYRPPVVIAGTGDEADQLVRRLARDAVSSLEPVALLSVRGRHVGERIQGVPILGRVDELEAVLRKLDARGIRPKRLIVTREALESGAEVDALLGTARRLGLAAVRPSQALTDIGGAGGSGAPVTLAPVSIDDLLGRSARELDLTPVRALVAGRSVLVTGAGGSIGSELGRQIAAMGPARLTLLDQSELALWAVARELRALHPALAIEGHLGDVCDAADLGRAFARARPQLVFHAAALKHVDLVEAHPLAGGRTNTLGTDAVAAAARAAGALCAVFISTDKAVEPVSVLGATKRAGELVFAAYDRLARRERSPTRFLTVRFGNVLGSSGSVIPLFAEQLRRGGPITVTDPAVERYFMTIAEAVRLVLMASTLGIAAAETAPIYVLDMGEPVRIVDLARRMIRLAGLEPDVDVAITYGGLRPGERLTEVLERTGETLAPTAIPGIRATEAGPGPDDAAALLAPLRAALAREDEGAVRPALRTIVAEYRPTAGADV